ncbi:spinster family MFS transporter [Sphingomonas sp. YL-JM2C]
MLFIVSVLSYVDRQVPFILVESIKADLGLSDRKMGLLTGFTFSFVYSTVAIPMAMLADRWSPKWVLSWGMLLWCGLTAAAGAAQNFVQLIGARMGLAVGEAAGLPASHSLISALLPPERRGVAIGMVSLGVPVGAMVGLALGGWLNDVANWRVAMVGVGIPGIVFALLFMALIPDVRGHAAAPAEKQGRLLDGLTELVRLRSMRHLVAGLSVQAIGQIAMFAFTAAFIIRSHHMSASGVGLLLGMTNGVSGIVALLIAGWATDRAAARSPATVLLLPAITFLVMAPLLVAGYLIPNLAVAMILLGIVNFCAVFYLPPAFATAQRLASPENRAQASALLVVGVSLIGGSIGPFAAGWISDALEPRFGADALRYSLSLAALPTLWGAAHLFIASRCLGRDLASVEHSA